MEDHDLHWLAGLLEGEGSFLKGPPSAPNQPRICCQMTDRDVIQRVAGLFEVHYINKVVPRIPIWKTSYQVLIRGIKAVELMKTLRPLMGERRQSQIDDAVASYSLIGSNKKLTKEQRIEIAEAVTSKTMTHKKLAEKYGVSTKTIQTIKKHMLAVNGVWLDNTHLDEISQEVDETLLMFKKSIKG